MTVLQRLSLIIIALALLAASGCEPQYTPEQFHAGLAYDVYFAESKEQYAKLGDPAMQPTAEKLRAMILKNQSFQMDRMPIGYWNYLSMNGKFDRYITKEDVAGWAENGVTMMKGPYWDHDDPRQYAKMMDLLDWCEEYDVRLMIPDGRMGNPGDGTPGRTQESRADVAAHPAFFGYHCCDEPRFSPEDPRDGGTPAYAAWMKQQVPNARAFVSLGGFAPGSEMYVGTDTYTEYLDRFGQFGDLDYFCGNQYGGMGPGRSGWNNYFGHMRLFREASWTYGIPFWASLCSVSHFGGRDIDRASQAWQFHAAIGSGATGAVWYYYYMRDPQKDYHGAPIDAWWRRTETWEVMRDLNQGFHRRYGDLFMNMAVVKVSFLPDAFGGGNVFEKDTSDVVGNVRAGYDTSHPMMISEFIDLEGQRYVVVMNLDMEKSVFMGVRYLGDDVEIYSYDWDGNEYRGSSHCAYGVPWPVKRGPGVLDGGYQIGPGEMFVQRVDSTRIRQSELTLKMRELAGLPPQEPLEVELARERLEQAETQEQRQKAQADLAELEAKYAPEPEVVDAEE
jgi:hypothetical protein